MQVDTRISIRPRMWAMTALVSSRIPLARSAMLFEATSIIHRLLKGLAIGFVEHAMGASKDFGAFLLRACRQAMDVTGDFDLFAQRQVLNTTDDGFDEGHSA